MGVVVRSLGGVVLALRATLSDEHGLSGVRVAETAMGTVRRRRDVKCVWPYTLRCRLWCGVGTIGLAGVGVGTIVARVVVSGWVTVCFDGGYDNAEPSVDAYEAAGAEIGGVVGSVGGWML